MANINTIKISQLQNIGSNLGANTLFPVVDTTGTYTTDKANVFLIGNYILNEAGNTLPQAYVSTLSESVVNAAQPNITSTGTLSSLSVVGNVNLPTPSSINIPGGNNGYFLQTNGNGVLSWSAAPGSGNGAPGGANTQIQFNDNGLFGGSAGLTYDQTTDTLGTVNILASNATIYDTLTVTNLNVPGNLNAENLSVNSFTTNNFTTTGNITANYFIGDGSQLTGITSTANGAGPNNSIQYNANGVFAGDSNLIWNSGTNTLNTNNITLTANISANKAYITGNVSANIVIGNYLRGDGSNITNIGNVANANYSEYSNIANLANSVAVANVVGIGNIATLSLDGNSSNILYGNGIFAAAPNVALSGDGGNLSNINGANVVGNVEYANYAYHVDVEPTTNNYAYHVVLVQNPGDNHLQIDGDDQLQYNPADGILTTSRLDAGFLDIQDSVISNLTPWDSLPISLGNNTNRWKDLYLSNSSIYLGDATISSNGNGIVVDSITVTGSNIGVVGNIASINLDGNVSNVLAGDGTWITSGAVSLPISNGTSEINIATANGPVTLTANGEIYSFGDGGISLPNNSNIDFAANNMNFNVPLNGAIQFYTDNGNYYYSFGNTGNFTAPGNISTPGNLAAGNLYFSTGGIRLADGATESSIGIRANGGIGYAGISIPNNDTANTVDLEINNSQGNVKIQSAGLDGWQFDKDNAINLPSPGTVRGNTVNMVADDFVQMQWVDSGNLEVPDPNNSGGPINWIYVEQNGAYIETNINLGNTRTWHFDNEGNITLPGGGIFSNPANSSLDPLNPNVSTISLIPDNNYPTQGLILDPTSPGHIHLRAVTYPSNIDHPISNLFLGGELSSFEVGSNYGGVPEVYIHSNNFTWTFDNSGNLTTQGSILPNADISYDLGSPTQRWRSLYLSGSTIYLGDVALSANATSNSLVVGDSQLSANGEITGTTLNVSNANFDSIISNTVTSNSLLVQGTTGITANSGNVNINQISGLGGYLNALGANLIGNIVANNISANSDLNVSGNAVINGNLSINGNLTYVNTQTLDVEDAIIQLQAGPNGAVPTSNTGKDVGSALNYYDTQARVAFMGWDVSNVEFALASDTSITNDVVTFNSYGNLRLADIFGHDITLTGNLTTGGDLNVGGDASLTGNVVIYKDLQVNGNINFTGNVTQISGNSGQFFGDANGIGALYAGIPVGFSPVYNPVIQASASANDYVQINFQNINHGTQASTDYVATTDDGTDTEGYIDMGIAGSTWDGTQTNSLGNALAGRDGYLYVQGGLGGGNLILGTTTTGTQVKFVVGGPTTGNIVANITSTGINTLNLSVTGNVIAGALKGEGGNISNIQGANVSGAVAYATTANSVAGANVNGEVSYAAVANSVAVGNVSGIGNIATINKDGNASNILYGNGVFASAPITYGNGNVATFLGNYGSNTITTTGNVSVGNIIGNGQALTGLNGANITGQVGNALIAGTVYTGSQPNITSTGTLTSLSVSGNSNIGNLGTGGLITATGNITGGNIIAVTDSYAGGNVWANGGVLRTTSTTANVFNSNATTVNIAGSASLAVNIGNSSGSINLSGNVQGNTNGFAIGYRDIPQVSFTGNATLALTDAGKHYYSTLSTANTLTVPNNASITFATGTAINIINQGSGTMTIAQGSGVTIYLAGNSTSGNRTLASYGMATLQKVATDTWFLVGVGLT